MVGQTDPGRDIGLEGIELITSRPNLYGWYGRKQIPAHIEPNLSNRRNGAFYAPKERCWYLMHPADFELLQKQLWILHINEHRLPYERIMKESKKLIDTRGEPKESEIEIPYHLVIDAPKFPRPLTADWLYGDPDSDSEIGYTKFHVDRPFKEAEFVKLLRDHKRMLELSVGELIA